MNRYRVRLTDEEGFVVGVTVTADTPAAAMVAARRLVPDYFPREVVDLTAVEEKAADRLLVTTYPLPSWRSEWLKSVAASDPLWARYLDGDR